MQQISTDIWLSCQNLLSYTEILGESIKCSQIYHSIFQSIHIRGYMSSPVFTTSAPAYQPRVKICGITRLEDALLACQFGADALGFVFYAPSPRAVSIEQVHAIIGHLPPFVTTVGLFVNAEPEFVHHVLQHIPLDRLQFHGEENETYCTQFAKPYIKALRVHAMTDFATELAHYPTAQALLLDTYVQGVQGGTGQVFDWKIIPQFSNKPLIIAGGLTCDNITDLLRCCTPYGVDVSGGVESQKGIKSAEKMQLFLQNVKK